MAFFIPFLIAAAVTATVVGGVAVATAGNKQESKTVTTNKITHDVMTKFISDCQQQGAATIEFTFKGKNIVIKKNTFDQNMSFDGKCINDIVNDQAVLTKVQESIKKQIEQDVKGFTLSKNENIDINETVNEVSTTITNEFVNSCAQSFGAAISQHIGDANTDNVLFEGNIITQNLQIAADCVNSNKNILALVDELNKKVKVKQSQSVEGFTGEQSMSSLASFLIAAIIGFIIFMMMMG